MSTLAAKRRRIEAANSALNKPFRSPLKAPLQQDSKSSEGSKLKTTAADPTNPSSNEVKSEEAQCTQTESHALPSHAPAAAPSPHANARRPSLPYRINLTKTPLTSNDPEALALRRDLIAVESQIRAVRADIDIINQAKSIIASGGTRRLEVQTKKWRDVARQAADEMFGTVKERVYQMGGVKAWKEEERRRRKRSTGWNDDNDNARGNAQRGEDEDEGEHSLGKREEMETRREEQEAEKRLYELEGLADGEGGGLDDSALEQEEDDDVSCDDPIVIS